MTRKLAPLFFAVLALAASGCGKQADASKNEDGAGKAGAGSAAVANLDGTSEKELKGLVKNTIRRTITALEKIQVQPGVYGMGPDKPDAGFTALALKALVYAKGPGNLSNPTEVATIGPGLEKLVSWQKDDGSIFIDSNANYVTSLAISTLALADRKKYQGTIDKARDYLLKFQYTPAQFPGTTKDNRHYGGAGYGKGRAIPDLSNTSFWLESLRQAGVPADHQAFKDALVYLSRCQNDSDRNPETVRVDVDGDGQPDDVRRSNDGGASYRPGENPKEVGYVKGADGGWRTVSYGAMSYNLLKSYLYIDLPRDDPRVQKAWSWVVANFTVDRHPGIKDDPRFKNAGYYYYLWVMARALNMYGVEEFKDAKGTPHRWRAEMARAILSRRRKSGFWKNKNQKWMEHIPPISTSYILMAMTDVYTGWKPGE